jgi:predicted nucleotidyltransferase
MDSINDLLTSIEKTNDVTIVLAVEAGSRAWNLHSATSDYDIRFVYVRNNREFYSDLYRNDNDCIGDVCGEMDYQGWDIIKAIKHLKESNPSFVEWLYTPIVYVNKFDFRTKCLEIINQLHTQTSLMHHYANMARKNWNDWISGKNIIIRKKYFHIIRPLAVLQWLMNSTLSSDTDFIVDVPQIIETLKDKISEDAYIDIKIIIEQKRLGIKTDTCVPIESINKWAIQQFESFKLYMQREEGTVEDLDIKVQSLISQYKKLVNETKKIRTFSSKNTSINRNDYLSAFGAALQFLWLIQHPDCETNKMPMSIGSLLSEVSIDKIVRDEIKDIIETKDAFISDEIPIIDNKTLCNTILLPTLELFSIITGKKVSEILTLDFVEKTTDDALKIRLYRDDLSEYLIRNIIGTATLVLDKKIAIPNLPKDIVFENSLLTDEQKKSINKCIKDLKPAYLTPKSEIISSWLEQICTEHKEKVDCMHIHLLKIREVNTEKRYNKSLKKINPVLFTELYRSVIR